MNVKIKGLILILLLFLLTAFPVAAKEPADELYEQQLEASGAQDVVDSVPGEARELMDRLGISDLDPDSVIGLSFGEIIGVLYSGVKEHAGAPLRALVSVIGIVLLSAVLDAAKPERGERALSGVYEIVAVLCISACLVLPVTGVISAAAEAIEACGEFTKIYVPVFAGVMITGGQAVSAGSFQILTLTVSQLFITAATGFIAPLLTIFLALSIAGSAARGIDLGAIAGGIKKAALWALAFIASVYVALMTLQSVIGSASDTATLKAAKFVVSNAVPVVGGALGDALGSVQGSIRLLKSSLGAFGIVAAAGIFLPVILESALWSLFMNLGAASADIFGQKQVSALLRNISSVLGVLLAVLLVCMLIIIFSTAVMLTLGGG